MREIFQGQVTRDIVKKLVDTITDRKQSSQGLLIVGNKHVHLRAHESILHSVSEIAHLGESSSFFLPDSFTGTSQQTQIVSALLEDKLLNLVPINLNRLDIMQEISAPHKPSMTSLISRLSLRKRAKQESQIINDDTFAESLKEVTKEAQIGGGIAQQLIQEALGQVHGPEKQTSIESQSQKETYHVQDLVQLMIENVRELSQRRVRNIQQKSHLQQDAENYQKILHKAQKSLLIIQNNKLKYSLFLGEKFAKIDIDEAMHVLQEFGDKLFDYDKEYSYDYPRDTYNPILESTYWVKDKVRYFSSRIKFNEPLLQLFGKDDVMYFSCQIEILSNKDKSENQSFWLCSPRIYLTKKQSESQAALEMCKILFSKDYLDEDFKPAIIRQSRTLEIFDSTTTLQPSEKQKQLPQPTDLHQLKEKEEQKIHKSHSQSKVLENGFGKSQSALSNNIAHDSTNESQSSQKKIEEYQIDKIKPRQCSVSHENIPMMAKLFFSSQQQKNKQKLDKGIKMGQHHMPIMHYNKRQLKLFIKNILNPILKALNQYNGLFDSKPTPDLIRFDDLNFNMISESSIKDLLFQDFQRNSASPNTNHNFIQFKNYRQRIFNIQNNLNEQRNDQEFRQLVQMIDQSLEKYKFPHYMTKHIQNYHSQLRGQPSQSPPIVKEEFNRKTFLTMLMIVLSDKEPTTMEFEKVKNEMGRLALVGESIIILCQVITLIFSGKKSFSEKDLDTVKNQTVKTEILKKRAQEVGVDFLKIQAKYYREAAPNPQVEGQLYPRDLSDVIQSLAGLFSIYLGFGATYLLLSDFGIIEPPTSDSTINIGINSVAQKVEILKKLSHNRRDLQNYQQEMKRNLSDILCKELYNGLYKEPLAGTEILEFWKKLVKSRGLSMKHDFVKIFPAEIKFELKEDDSNQQLRDYSIALSKNNSSSSSQCDTDSNPSQNDSDYDSITDREELNKELEEEYKMMQKPSEHPEAISEVETAQNVKSSLRESCSKYSKDITKSGDYEESKTGQEEIFDEIEEPNQMLVDYFENQYKELNQEGYEFKNSDLLLQSIVHSSMLQKLWNQDTQNISSIDKSIIFQQGFFEYLGDSILNFTISKLFYCETANNKKQWHGDFFIPTKLHELKTWFSSNIWLSFALYENYYCTITEEIPRDGNFQNSKIFKQAQENLQQPSHKKISQNEWIKVAPRVPLIYEKNDKFEEQINNFNATCFRQCLAADQNNVAKLANDQSEGLKVTSKSLSLKLFKDKDVQEQDQNEVDFSEIDEKFVKYFSEVMEAFIGGIFMDSGDLDKTQMILLKLINCPSVSAFPIVQHDRTAVLSVFNSKPYCKGIKLYHTMEEKDGNTYIMGYMGKLQFRRLKYSQERKKKVFLFYYDMRLYLEDAYKEFEMQFIKYRKLDDKQGPTIDEWLEFNKNFRKTWRVKVYSADQKRYSAIKEAAKKLYKFVTSPEENFKTREFQNIDEMRVQIIKYLDEGLKQIGAHPKNSLLVLESERVQSSRIRELFQSSDINFIDCLSYGMKDVGNFVEKLNNRQVQQFYEHLIEFGK